MFAGFSTNLRRTRRGASGSNHLFVLRYFIGEPRQAAHRISGPQGIVRFEVQHNSSS
jgi:hypothetical protein